MGRGRRVRVEEVPPESWRARLAADWDRLLEDSADATIFQSLPWVEAWWRHFGQGRRARILTVRGEDGVLCCLAPLYERSLRLLNSAGPRILGLMGDAGVGSEYLGVLVRQGERDAALRALGDALRGGWAVADLCGLREDSEVAQALPGVFSPPGRGRLHVERHPCSAVPLPSDYGAYLAALPQKFRSTVRYRTNKLTKNFAVRLLRTGREAEIRTHLDRFFEMHQARWEAEGHSGSFHGRSKRAFYEDVSSEFLRRGWLRFFHLEVDGTIRASQFGFAFRGVLHSLQEAFDHEFRPPGVSGMGVVLRGMVFRECIAEGIRAYDFLGGDDEFKTRWGTRTHYVRRVRIGAPGLQGAVAFGLTTGARRLKDRLREFSPGWVLECRERLRVWMRSRRARQASQHAGRAEG